MLASFVKHVFYATIEWRSSILDGDLAMKIPSNNRKAGSTTWNKVLTWRSFFRLDRNKILKIKMEEDPSAWDFQRNAIYYVLVCIVNSKGPESNQAGCN